MTASGIDRRLARLEAMVDEAPVTGGVSGILAASARHRADRIARGLPADDDAPPPPWAVRIYAAMAEHRQERRA